MQAASRSDGEAIAGLLERFLPDLYRYVDRRRGALAAKESSSDLVQSVCRELLERLDDRRFVYRGEAEFRKWLYRAALMKLSTRRRFWSAERRDARRNVELAVEPDGGGASPSHDASLEEELTRVRQVMDALPERYREVIVLAQVEGLSHREIGARLGVTESNSRMLLSRALARLATLGLRAGG